MPKPRVLIVEDIASLSMAYAAHLEGAGFDCIIAGSGQAALAELRQNGHRIDAVILDLQLPDIDGLALLQNDPSLTRHWPIVVATADGSISRAIEAMRLGAYDFLVKPLSPPRLIAVMKSATANRQQRVVEKPAAQSGDTAQGFGDFIGTSPPMRAIYRQIENIARSRATVFITGESGTGKEVCATTIHKISPRAERPFVAINCGAIPEHLLESELFGHLKGSFTGAVSDRVGAVQSANGGTLFLDEICEMELKLQVKLLRFLQTGTVQRVGATRTEDVDVRIICATNRNPEREVAEGRFREDLFYRLAVVPVELPPLRLRGGDIGLLANALLQKFAREEGKTFRPLSIAFENALAQHNWPGNVRELQNLIRRAAVMFDGPDLPLDALPRASIAREMPTAARALEPAHVLAAADAVAPPSPNLIESLNGMTLDEIERIVIENAIVHAGGSLPLAAKALGVSPSTLYRKRERWTANHAA